MEYEIENHSKFDLEKYKELVEELLEFAGDELDLDHGVKVVFIHNAENSKNPLGKTAFYLPSEETIAVYATDRHIKDMLRSMVHELIHHKQKERGEFEDNSKQAKPGYAIEDKELRDIEREAYEEGNLIFRTFEDKLKTKKFENAEMEALSKRLKDKFGFKFHVD